MMPTRYTLELEGLKGVVSQDTFKEVSQREEAKKTVKKALEDRYTSGKNRWFFTPLRMFFCLRSVPSAAADRLQVSKRGSGRRFLSFERARVLDEAKVGKSIEHIRFTSMGLQRKYTIAGSRIGNVSMNKSRAWPCFHL